MGALSGIFAIWKQYKKEASELTLADRKAKNDETDESLRRAYALLDRVQKEHNDDRINLAKLQDEYMVVRDELARCRERCAYLEQRVEQLLKLEAK